MNFSLIARWFVGTVIVAFDLTNRFTRFTRQEPYAWTQPSVVLFVPKKS
jgi:hypothetical protein